MPSRGKAGTAAVRGCVCCARAWCAAGGSGHVVGQSMWARPHPAPLLVKEPSATQGPPTPPDVSLVQGPPALGPSLLPGLAPGQWTVLTCVALVPPLPACTVCHRAVIARMPSASALVAARAVPATLARALPYGGVDGRSCGRGGGDGLPAQIGTQAPEAFQEEDRGLQRGGGRPSWDPPTIKRPGWQQPQDWVPPTAIRPPPATGQGPAFAPLVG